MRTKYLFSIFLIFIFTLSACAPALKVSRMKPAAINLSGYKKIAIGDVKGIGGDEISYMLTQALFDSGRFEVLDRENLRSIMKEQEMSIGDEFDPNSSVELGKMIGSAALVFGNVTRRDYNQKTSTTEGTCSDGKRQWKCSTFTLTGTWNQNASFKVIDTSSGKILATKGLKKSTQRSISKRERHPSPDWTREDGFAVTSKGIIDEFMKVIAPYRIVEEVKLFTNKKLPELKKGIDFAKNEDWNNAIEQFREACNKADKDPEIKDKIRARAHYNLGIALGYSGQDYDEAIKEIENAIKIKPEDEFYKAIKKIKGFKRDAERLKDQQVKAIPFIYNFVVMS